MRHLTVCRCITAEMLYDEEDTEEYNPLEMARASYVEDYNFDVPEGMELTYTRHRPDDGNTREVNAVNMVGLCGISRSVNKRTPESCRERTLRN